MKWFKVLLVTLAVSGLLLFSLSCKGGPAAVAKPQISTVQRGNISILVTGTGNLALAQSEDMAFAMAGTVDQVLVSAGDSVKKGQELAKLDTTVWDTQVKTLTKSLTAAQRSLTNSQNAIVTQQNNLTKAQRNISAKQMAVTQAQMDLQSAQNTVTNMADVKAAQDEIDRIQKDLDFAEDMLKRAAQPDVVVDVTYWTTVINGDKNLAGKPNNNGLKAQLAQAQKDLQEILSGTSLKVTTDIALQVAQTEFRVQQSQRSLEDAQIAVEDAKTAVANSQTAVANAQLDVADAQQNVADAQKNLDDTKALNPILTAPFDGFVTKINSKGGDTVQKGTVAMQVADPNQFQANIMVSERDIFSVKIGGDATVSLDSLSGLSFPAKITAIAPLATVQQGVVNYQVTVELTSLSPTPSAGGLAAFRTSGQLPAGLGQGALAGRPDSSAPAPSLAAPDASASGTASAPGARAGAAAAAPGFGAAAAPAVTLKSGLSATVNVVVQEKNGILLVPNRAVTRQGRNSVVQVVTGTTTEARTVTTGISDSLNTEITEGLNEGDQVSIAVSTTSATPANRPGAVPGVPGIGGGGGTFRIGG